MQMQVAAKVNAVAREFFRRASLQKTPSSWQKLDLRQDSAEANAVKILLDSLGYGWFQLRYRD